MNSTDRAIIDIRDRADAVALARARMAGAMRTLRDFGGKAGVRAVFEAEFERLTASANDNKDWIG